MLGIDCWILFIILVVYALVRDYLICITISSSSVVMSITQVAVDLVVRLVRVVVLEIGSFVVVNLKNPRIVHGIYCRYDTGIETAGDII